MAEGAVLASFRSDAWRTQREEPKPPVARTALLVERATELRAAREAVRLGVAVAESQNEARRLSNQPPNALTPAALAREARQVAAEVGLACRVFDVPELRKRKMGALLAVGQGSANPPRLVVLEHRPRRSGRPTVCLVGKGITFDSGGISIKPSAGMQDMKHDMSGAAAVVGALRAAALLDVPLHVVGILAAAENLPGGGAYRPGDILTSMSGQTIEIQNTDAEGRLVLCDALHFARTHYEPAAIIDLATLTGACVVALGSYTSGLFGNHEGLAAAIRRASEATGERTWPMPLFDEHRDEMRSQIADLKNVSGSRDAGASTAAAFLSRFVGDTPWAHLDIAGTAYTGKPGPCQPYGATGVGVRLLAELLQEWPRGGLV
jgi:leucyl aminopeptidase